jgi:thiol:disulfide interchange protein
MLPNTPSHKQLSQTWKGSWPGLIVILLLVGTVAYCFLERPVSGLQTTVEAQSVAPAAVPFVPKHIYSETANPTADISAALAQAKRQHKRVLLDFGGDWCGDCQVLDIYFRQPPNAQLLKKNFVLVHIWIGHMDANIAVTQKYGVPINKGVPALAVLGSDGKVVYAQEGEFEDMRHMDPSSVTAFLEKWKS